MKNAPKDFEEAGYLARHSDVAEAVKSGFMPSGLWHYMNHGRHEGRPYKIDPLTDRSPAWTIYKKHAKFHDQIDDFKLFNSLMEKLEQKEPFHVARYNDGEWVFMLRIEPYYSKYIREHGHQKEEVEQISAKLLQIIESCPPYYIGIDSTTRALQGTIVPRRDTFKEKVAPLPNVIFGDIFNAATVRFGIERLRNPLLQRHTIAVGPPHMEKLGLAEHIIVPTTNCWRQAEQINSELNSKIESVLEQQPVIVYSCSLLAKLLIDINYHRYKNQITQLDIGSCIDPWCGIITRPWHRELAKHYHLTVTVNPDFFCF